MSLTPETTWTALLIVQTLHLLHHLLTKRHISCVEVTASAVLIVPLSAAPPILLMGMHIGLILVQLVGSIWIRRLSPGCGPHDSVWSTLG